MPRAVHVINEALAFVFELIALVAIGWWGAHAPGSTLDQVLLAVGGVAVAIVAWGLFAAPRSRIRTPLPVVLLVKLIVFGAAACGLFFTGHPVLGTVFAVLVAINTVLATLDRQAAVNRSRAS